MLTLLIYIIVIGLLVWLIEAVIPLPPPFHLVVRVIAVLIVILLLLQFVGFGGVPLWARRC